MKILLYGGSACGKSALAEALLLKSPGEPRIYAATMEPWGPEAQQRIRRHRAMRAEKGFQTVEAQRGLKSLALPQGCAVLLECLGNLAANELFAPGATGESALQAMLAGVRSLARRAETLVMVGNDVFADGVPYQGGTAAYLHLLAEAQARLAAEADAVAEVVCGIPILHKGSLAFP